MNGRQIFSIHIVLKCQRSSEAQTFARLQHFCTFVIEIKDRMQYCMEESKRGYRARALGIGTRLLYALRAALRAARAGVMIYRAKLTTSVRWNDTQASPRPFTTPAFPAQGLSAMLVSPGKGSCRHHRFARALARCHCKQWVPGRLIGLGVRSFRFQILQQNPILSISNMYIKKKKN